MRFLLSDFVIVDQVHFLLIWCSTPDKIPLSSINLVGSLGGYLDVLHDMACNTAKRGFSPDNSSSHI